MYSSLSIQIGVVRVPVPAPVSRQKHAGRTRTVRLPVRVIHHRVANYFRQLDVYEGKFYVDVEFRYYDNKIVIASTSVKPKEGALPCGVSGAGLRGGDAWK